MVFKNSQIWTMSTGELEAHLAALTTPDRVYWDAKELKRDGKKFQSMSWAAFRRAVKIDGEWVFEGEAAS